MAQATIAQGNHPHRWAQNLRVAANFAGPPAVLEIMRSVEFTPGQTILRRYWTGERITVLNVLRVISDDQFGLRLWLPVGTPYWRILTEDGRTQHQAPFEIAGERSTLSQVVWQGSDVMIWVPPSTPYSVWWFWDPATAEFRGWYGNLEAPAIRWDDGELSGFDTVDHALDLWVEPDNSWSWKDIDEFNERTGHPLYWNTAAAAAIQKSGVELANVAQTAKFPFDGTWTGFRPDPNPLPTALPAGWDRPRAQNV